MWLLFILPLLIPIGLAFRVVEIGRLWGGGFRVVAAVLCLGLGAITFGGGWYLAFEGLEDGSRQVTYPIAGWFGLILGGLTGVLGTLQALFGSELVEID